MTKKHKRRDNAEPKPNLKNRKNKTEGWDSLWYGLSLLTAALWTICGMIYSEHKTPAIWLLFSGIVIAAFAACMYWQVQVWKAERGLSFSTKVLSFLQGPNPSSGKTSPFQYAFNTGSGPAITPVYALLNIRLINDNNVPLTVGSYRLECENEGNWEKVPKLDGRAGTLYWVYPQMTSAIQLHADSLDAALADKAIPPHESVRGWVLLQGIPTKQMRLYVRDIGGNSNTVEFKTDKSSVGDNADSLEQSGINVMGTPKVDLSKLKYFAKHGE